MTPTTGSATSNKRRRGGGNAMETTPAAITGPRSSTATTILSTLSSRLEPIKDLLVLQPDELKGHLISKSTEMLDLRVTIKQREKSYARFEKPMTDATTGAVKNNEAGEPLPFIPSSLRSKCPIKASKQTDNDTEMNKLLEEAAKTHAAYQKEMTAYAKHAGKLEITLRQTKLRHLLYELIETIAITHHIIATVKGNTTGAALTREESKMKATYDVLTDSTPKNAVAVAMETGAKLAEEYSTLRSFDNQAIESKLKDEDDRLFIKPFVNQMNTWLPRFSVDLWDKEDDIDQQRIIDAKIREALKPPAMLSANEDVEAAMDAEDADTPPQSVIEFIRKEQQKGMEKQMQLLKKQMRKNCSGGGESQPLQPTDNGRKSKKHSAGTATKKKKQVKAPKKDNAAPKKKVTFQRDATNPNHKSQPRSKSKDNQDSQGGSSGGGKRRGAARR